MTSDACGHQPTAEGDKQRMMAQLFGTGWGYHQIADLCGRSHPALRELLMRNWPAVEERPHWNDGAAEVFFLAGSAR